MKEGRGTKNSPASQRGRKEAQIQSQQTSKPASKSRKEVGERHTAGNDIVNTEEELPSAAINLNESEVANCEGAKNSLEKKRKKTKSKVKTRNTKKESLTAGAKSTSSMKMKKKRKKSKGMADTQKNRADMNGVLV